MSPSDPTPDGIRPKVPDGTLGIPAAPVPPDGAIMPEPAYALPPEPSPPPHPPFWWSVLWCIGFVLVTQLPGGFIAAAIVIGYAIMHPGEAQTLASPDTLFKTNVGSAAVAAGFFVNEVLVIGVSLLVIRLVVGRDWTRQLAVRQPSAAHVSLAVVSLPALVVLSNGAYGVLRRFLPDLGKLIGAPSMDQIVTVFSDWPVPFGVLVIGLGPGLGEELWCRGFLGRGLVGNYGFVFGVILTAFFFGLIHVDPAQGTMAMLMGLYLHFTYLATRSLWVPVLLHFLNNSLAVVSPRLHALDVLDADPAKAPLHLFIAAGALLAAVAWALYTSRARLVSQEAWAFWRPAAPGVEYPPEGSAVSVVRPQPSLVAWGLTLLAVVAFVGSCYAVVSGK
jgi:membrane protease YdiL (CAAX protease family)